MFAERTNVVKMRKKNLIYLIVAIVVLVALIYLIVLRTNAPGKYDSFAQCLTDNGVVMYGTDWCRFCQDQKGRFGAKSFKLIDYVNCDFNGAECANAGVQGYPTWLINEQTYSGVQSLQSLSSLTGCSLE